jgi:Protein of unknown function (DUF3105)
MKIGKLGYLTLAMLLAGLMACSDDGGGGGGDDGSDDGTSDGTGDDGTGDDGTGDDGTDDGTEPDAGGDGGDGDGSTACLTITEITETSEGWPHPHDPIGTEITWANEPPSSGRSWTEWAMWAAHPGVVPRGYWVHNIEHGGVALLRSPDASEEVITALAGAYEAIPDDEACGHKRAILAIDEPLATQVAVVAADVVMTGDCIDDPDAILQFVAQYRNNANAREDNCDQGTFVGE